MRVVRLQRIRKVRVFVCFSIDVLIRVYFIGDLFNDRLLFTQDFLTSVCSVVF